MKLIEIETQGVLQNRADDLLEIEEDMRKRQEALEILEVQVEEQMKDNEVKHDELECTAEDLEDLMGRYSRLRDRAGEKKNSLRS